MSGSSWEWFRPLQAGDGIYSFGGTESVVEKKSEFAERSLLMTYASVKMNQRAEIVAISRTLAIYTERKTAREKGKYADLEPATYSDEDMARLDAIYAAEEPRGSVPRYWEDVEVGDALAPMAKGPLTTTDMIVFHAGGYGFVPYEPCANRIAYKNRQRIAPFYVKNEYGVPDVAQRVHWDNAWAQAIGNPMAYDYGVMRDCWLSHYMTDWMGDEGWLVSQSSEIRKFNYIGDSHVFSGEVVGKRVEDGRLRDRYRDARDQPARHRDLPGQGHRRPPEPRARSGPAARAARGAVCAGRAHAGASPRDRGGARTSSGWVTSHTEQETPRGSTEANGLSGCNERTVLLQFANGTERFRRQRRVDQREHGFRGGSEARHGVGDPSRGRDRASPRRVDPLLARVKVRVLHHCRTAG